MLLRKNCFYFYFYSFILRVSLVLVFTLLFVDGWYLYSHQLREAIVEMNKQSKNCYIKLIRKLWISWHTLKFYLMYVRGRPKYELTTLILRVLILVQSTYMRHNQRELSAITHWHSIAHWDQSNLSRSVGALTHDWAPAKATNECLKYFSKIYWFFKDYYKYQIAKHGFKKCHSFIQYYHG